MDGVRLAKRVEGFFERIRVCGPRKWLGGLEVLFERRGRVLRQLDRGFRGLDRHAEQRPERRSAHGLIILVVVQAERRNRDAVSISIYIYTHIPFRIVSGARFGQVDIGEFVRGLIARLGSVFRREIRKIVRRLGAGTVGPLGERRVDIDRGRL